MSSRQAHQLAQSLCESTRLVLLPDTASWLRRHATRARAGMPVSPLELRVGHGRATHHRFDYRSGEHRITFGVKMVADKLDPANCGGWLSTREIIGRRYFGGEVSVANLLAHTGCHEFAHFIQTLAGARRRGQVHNGAFYRILDELHTSGAAGAFRDHLLERSASRGYPLATAAVGVADWRGHLSRFEVGDPVRFGRSLEGRITRINRKTCTVEGTGPCRGLRYRVSPQLLEIVRPEP